MKKLSLTLMVKNDLYAWVKGMSTDKIIGWLEVMLTMSKSGIIGGGDDGSNGSTVKGVVGEKAVYGILSEHYKVEECGYHPHSGDLMIYYGGQKYLVEVKNYKNSVPSIEMVKFIRDISEGDGIGGGVFVCLGAVVPRYKEVYNIDYVGGVMVIIINSRDPIVIQRGVNILIQACNRRDINVVDENNRAIADIRGRLEAMSGYFADRGESGGESSGIDMGTLRGKIGELRDLRGRLSALSHKFIASYEKLTNQMLVIETNIIDRMSVGTLDGSDEEEEGVV